MRFISRKTWLKALIIIFFIHGPFAIKAQLISLKNNERNAFSFKTNTYYELSALNVISNFKLFKIATEKGIFNTIEADGYTKIYDIGRPQLPVLSKLIELPYCSDLEIRIIKAEYKDLDLASLGYSEKLLPCQVSYSKSTEPDDMVFYYDEDYYNTDRFNENTIVKAERSGIMRGLNIGQLSVSPFSYNPARHILRVYHNIEFEILFKNADVPKTIDLKKKYFSPAFQPVYSKLSNYKDLELKEYLCTYPITYVIVSPNTFQAALKPFVDWKTLKGFNVIEAYTSDPNVGTSTTSIKNYLQGLYDGATPTNPAPSYVLFVGDVAQIPAFSGTAGSHVSDMYYCEYDGGSDYIPELYYGRFSATNLTQLQPQIDKTLLYEKYIMDETAYLDTVVLVAGVDASYAPTHANGQINYGVNNYFNASNGIYSHTYLYPGSQSQAAQIRADIGKGVGLANYTAHCNSSGWGDPSFTTSHIPAMTNNNKYGLMIGNCCLSNKFDDNECFGEGLLRAVNKGAVGYIGGSNNTLWDEDFYWGVGYTSNINANPTYAGTGMGAYDGVFHSHGEPEMDWYITNAQMIFAGNMGVQASSSSSKKYYWEIYHLMGDPSLMTYLYEPSALLVNYTDPIVVGETTLTVNTEPGAYVALSNDNVLITAVLADVNGIAQLTFPPFLSPDTAYIVVTKQNKIPYIGTLKIINVSLALDAAMATILEPGNQYNCAGLSITPRVVIRNMGLNTLQSLTINYRINSGNIVQYQWAGNLISLGADTISLTPFNLTLGQHILKVFCSSPNNSTDMNIVNDTVQKSFTVSNMPVLSAFTASDTSFCNIPATVNFVNQSVNASSYLWDFGDGITSTDISPVHVYQTIGQYNVSLTADAGACGSHSFTLPQTIDVGLPPPDITHAEHCGSASLTLSATGYNDINWFYSPLSPVSFHSGTSYTTPLLDTTTTYYVQGSVINSPFNVGKTDNSGGGGYYNNSGNSHFLIFDCYTPVELLSVKVYASGAGNRKILLRDSTQTILDSVTVYMPAGESRVNLNFNVPVGNKLQLVGNGAVNLYRNNNNSATYPYEVSGIISIIESSASLPQYNYTYGNYYYFYDWEVKEPDCYSQMQEVTAYILDEPECQFTHNLTGYTVQFNDQSLYAMNYMWYFGDGNSSTQANPVHTYSGPGTYNVKLVIGNICGADSTEMQITVVGMAPVVDFTADNVQITEGDFVSFTDLSEFVPHTWSWIFEGGTPSQSSLQDPVIQYNTQGAYYVTLVATNDFGNGFANKPYYINVEPSSVKDSNNENLFSIYPNPVKGNSFVLISGTNLYSSDDINIYNIIGEEISFIKNDVSNGIVRISFNKISSGIYFLSYKGSKQISTVKFIVY